MRKRYLRRVFKIQKAARKVVAYRVLYPYGLMSCHKCYRAMKIKPEEHLQAHYCKRCQEELPAAPVPGKRLE